MNVEQLIEQLLKIEDKSKEVWFIGHSDDSIIESVEESDDYIKLYDC